MTTGQDSHIVQLIIAIILGFGAAALGLLKYRKAWKETSTETFILNIMHQEIERMSAQNILLATELNKLQLEVIKLTKELHKLSLENQKLTEEIATFNIEINRLQHILKENNIVGVV